MKSLVPSMDVVLGFFRGFSLEGKLTGLENIEKNTKIPDIRLSEVICFLNDFGSSGVKVLASLN